MNDTPRHLPRVAVDASALILLFALWSGAAHAQSQQQRPEGPPRGGPPPEALAACKSLAAGNACSFSVQSRTMKGTCWAPEGKPLACRPADAPPPPRQQQK